jgi:hypothetical protein
MEREECLESARAFAPCATRRRMGRSRCCSCGRRRASRAGVDLPCKSGEPSPMEEEVAMSGNKQRRFTDEFKREAVRLIETSGRSVQRMISA